MPKRPNQANARGTRATPLAARADKYDCYQRAVQCPEAEIDFVDETFRALRGRTAHRLREDFCGTANTSCEWVRRRPRNVAYGFDLDPVPLDWGRKHNISRLTPAARSRIELRESDVLAAHPDLRGTLDCILAMNFSFWIFRDRATLLAYFRRVREDLAGDGVFFLDFYGGSDALREITERRPIPRAGKGDAEFSVTGFASPFTYIWQQERYNPITGDLVCHIHFAFPDGSRIRNAFTYNWRLWGLREVRDLLAEAGFKRTTVYWEGDDKDGEGNGVFTASEQGEACASWICYITAEK
ncbi:MAG TPA: class I SAM-dependent methyltransferase [Phycisphaerales bacterium]|nr:class I SAM-dependent methyltransferase [Phycisphaerales bacterium]